MSYYNGDSTICAEATPAGYGGISIVRVSGKSSLNIVAAMTGQNPEKFVSHKARLLSVFDPSGDCFDQAVVTFFKGPKSFTGEDCAEIALHGNPLIVAEALRAAIHFGARMALPGEFTSRAFINGRIDLTQAESVMELIHAGSPKAARNALHQLNGDLRTQILQISDSIEKALAHIEASIDFSLENLETESNSVLCKQLSIAATDLKKLSDGFRLGRVIKDGFKVSFLGAPNAGKSSLLNCLLQSDRALVSDIPGTTRDVVEDFTLFSGQKYVFLDTAGLRQQTSDSIEILGMERSLKSAHEADLILAVIAADSDLFTLKSLLASLNSNDWERVLVLINKIDLVEVLQSQKNIWVTRIKEIYKSVTGKDLHEARVQFVSAKECTSRITVLRWLESHLPVSFGEASSVVTSERQSVLIRQASDLLFGAVDKLSSGDGAEFVAFDVKDALIKLYGVLGKQFDDQIMDKVFKEFCLGK